ncbi:MAG: MBL fold metallo-hydrolase [Chloroflexi bacterium]|nr:MBL fold metallo-hydrolase [Chloroflexota bacterium]
MLKATHFDNVIRFDLARTLFGQGRYWTAAYFIDGMLVDSGCAYTAGEVVRALSDLPLTHLVNTHSHEDHIGANGALQRTREGLKILAHPLALPILGDPRLMQPLHPYRRLFWGLPARSKGEPLADGSTIETEHYSFRVVYTPGHSPDHLCLYEPVQGWLFTGDLFVGGHERALRAGYDIRQITASLKRIAALPAAWLFPGSARVRDHPEQALAEKIAYLEKLGAQVEDLDRQGRSVPEIARALCGGPMLVEWITLGHLSREHLVRSFLGSREGVEPSRT